MFWFKNIYIYYVHVNLWLIIYFVSKKITIKFLPRLTKNSSSGSDLAYWICSVYLIKKIQNSTAVGLNWVNVFKNLLVLVLFVKSLSLCLEINCKFYLWQFENISIGSEQELTYIYLRDTAFHPTIRTFNMIADAFYQFNLYLDKILNIDQYK
jgi:hypothetical protein